MNRIPRESFNQMLFKDGINDDNIHSTDDLKLTDNNNFKTKFSSTNLNNTKITDDIIYSSSETNKDTIEEYEIDLDKFDVLCSKFRKIHDLRISDLNESDKKDFDIVLSYVKLLTNTNYYNLLFDCVKCYFHDLNKVYPGTIGSYFAGCLVDSNFAGIRSCNVTCAGSIQLPDNENVECNKAVIWAEYKLNNNNYYFNFDILKQADNYDQLNPVYLYITTPYKSFNNVKEFPGFTKSEKQELYNLGIKELHLMSYNEDCKYIDLYGRPIKLEDVKVRNNKNTIIKNKHNNNNHFITLIIILLIILFIAMFIIPYLN